MLEGGRKKEDGRKASKGPPGCQEMIQALRYFVARANRVHQLTLKDELIPTFGPAFRDIGGNRARSVAHLSCQRIEFFPWKGLRRCEDLHCQFKSLLVDFDVLESLEGFSLYCFH